MSVSGNTVRRAKLGRRSSIVDHLTKSRARKALGVASESDADRLSAAKVVEMDEFWQFMKKSRGAVKRGSFCEP